VIACVCGRPAKAMTTERQYDGPVAQQITTYHHDNGACRIVEQLPRGPEPAPAL
jgi:hypothetical protein